MAQSYADPNANNHVYLLKKCRGALFRNLLNPCRVACHLIRLGHEPLPPEEYTDSHPLYGDLQGPIAFYPNAISYNFYLMKKYGCWNVITCGFFSSICLDIARENVEFVYNQYFIQWSTNSPQWLYAEEMILNDQSEILRRSIGISPNTFAHFIFILKRKAYEIFLTQPFFGEIACLIMTTIIVILMRQTAGLISEADGYYWFPQAVVSIYNEEGLLGFFSVCIFVHFYFRKI